MQHTELSPLTNFNATEPKDLNDQGQVVGNSYEPFQPTEPSSRATRWVQRRQGWWVPTALSDSLNRTEARRINNKGEALYVEYNTPTESDAPTFFLWKKGKAVNLETVVPGLKAAIDLNDQSQLLGVAESEDGASA